MKKNCWEIVTINLGFDSGQKRPLGVEILYPHPNLHADVYGSFIHNCQNMGATRCLSRCEWIDELWYIQTIQFYSVVERNELSGNKNTWRSLKIIKLSERSWSEKLNSAWFQLCDLWEGKTKEAVKRSGIPRSWGDGGGMGGAQRNFRTVKLFCMML